MAVSWSLSESRVIEDSDDTYGEGGEEGVVMKVTGSYIFVLF